MKNYRKFLTITLTLVLAPFLSVHAQTPIEIDTCVELQMIGNDEAYPLDGDYILTQDIDCSETATWNEDGDGGFLGFTPIGHGGEYFTGSLDGGNFSIENLYIRSTSSFSYTGLFYGMDGASISDLDINNATIISEGDLGNIGGLAGRTLNMGATVDNFTFSGTIQSDLGIKSATIGGIFGFVNGYVNITNSSTNGTFTGGVSGGIIGYLQFVDDMPDSLIQNSFSEAVISGQQNVGGLLGRADDVGTNLPLFTIDNSYYQGQLSVGDTTSQVQVGGLVGLSSRSEVSISNSYSIAGISHSSSLSYVIIGGVAGQFTGDISGSFSDSDIEVQAGASALSGVGGLVGVKDGGSVTNSFAKGSVEFTVSSGMSFAGGLIGAVASTTIDNSYSITQVSGSNADTGGLVGGDLSDSLPFAQSIITNSFWDTETSGQETSSGGQGKTTAEMKTLATFSGAGWDIAENDADLNDGYPYLSWQDGDSDPIWYIVAGEDEEPEPGDEDGGEEDNNTEEEESPRSSSRGGTFANRIQNVLNSGNFDYASVLLSGSSEAKNLFIQILQLQLQILLAQYKALTGVDFISN